MTQVNEMYKRLFTRSKVATPDLLAETTWADLFMKKENGQLIPGQMYRITDYTLVTPDSFEYDSETIPLESAGKRFDVVVTALSEDILSEDALAMHNKTQDSFSTSDLNKWAIKYSIYNTVKVSMYGELIPYPYVKRPLYNPLSMIDAEIQDDVAQVTLNGGRSLLMYVDRNDGEYAMFYDVDEHTYYYTLEGVEEVETFYTKVPYPTVGDTVYTSFEGNIVPRGTIQSIEWHLCPQGKGTIYRMVDEFNNSLPYDFKNLKWGYTAWMLNTASFEEGDVNTTDFVFSVVNTTPSEDCSLSGRVFNVCISDAISIGHFIDSGEGIFSNICIENVIELLMGNDTNTGVTENIDIKNSGNIFLMSTQNLTIVGVDLYETPMPGMHPIAPKTMGMINYRNSRYPYIFWKEIANSSTPAAASFSTGNGTHFFTMVDKGFIYNRDGGIDNTQTQDTWIPITVLAQGVL